MKTRFNLAPAILCVVLLSGVHLQAQLRQTPVNNRAAVTANNPGLSLDITPNPVKVGGQISFTYSGPENQNVTFRIFNAIGRNVYDNTVFHDSGEINDVVNIGQLPKGLYFFQAASDNQVITHRLLIME